MDARRIEHAADELERKRRRAAHAGALAGLALVLVAAAIPLAGRLAVALVAGAGAEALVVAAAIHGRRELIARLVLEREAYVLPEVRRYGSRLVRLSQRQRLAAWLREVVADARLPGSLYLPERVARHARDLDSLARELASPAARVQPTSAVACLQLLTRAVESPLYNARLPADELALALRSIRAGIASPSRQNL